MSELEQIVNQITERAGTSDAHSSVLEAAAMMILKERTVADKHVSLVKRAIAGLKNIGDFRDWKGEDPHPLDCSLAGRISWVFGLGMTRSCELCHDYGENPHFKRRYSDAGEEIDQ